MLPGLHLQISSGIYVVQHGGSPKYQAEIRYDNQSAQSFVMPVVRKQRSFTICSGSQRAAHWITACSPWRTDGEIDATDTSPRLSERGGGDVMW